MTEQRQFLSSIAKSTAKMFNEFVFPRLKALEEKTSGAASAEKVVEVKHQIALFEARIALLEGRVRDSEKSANGHRQQLSSLETKIGKLGRGERL